ncbi:hypothetical protein LTR04_003682 [Oleoguttula sp. CCFEE 6159]|nr:hypothetical protein LTR04_003682 [Oleoguttula sp. CCFEE 6159]
MSMRSVPLLTLKPLRTITPLPSTLLRSPGTRASSSDSKSEASKDQAKIADSSKPEPKKKMTQAQLDEELRLKMEGLSGDGGASGVEYEDGQPVAMKRSVKNNMFRYI